MERAFFFSVDAFIALILIVMVLFGLLLFVFIPRMHYEKFQNIASDCLNDLDALQMHEVRDQISPNIEDGVQDWNLTVLEQIGVFWSANQTDLASNLTATFLEPVIPQQYAFVLAFENQSVYGRIRNYSKIMFSDARLVSGLEQDVAVYNYAARAWVKYKESDGTNSSVPYGGIFANENDAIEGARGRMQEQYAITDPGDPLLPINTTVMQKIPYMWGPSVIRLVIWI